MNAETAHMPAVPPVGRAEEERVMKALGETIRRLRKAAHMSQQKLADILFLHQAGVCRVELGQQSVHPWHLQQLSEVFGVRVSDLMSGSVNFWQVAERFGQKPPFPAAYTKLPYSKVRELLPIIRYMNVVKGTYAADHELSGLGLDLAYLRNPDQPIGVNCTLDLLRHSVRTGLVTPKALSGLAAEARNESVQGGLHSIYESQEVAVNLIKTLVLNAHHYESNFIYELEDDGRQGLELSVKPAAHMKGVPYKDEFLGDILCQYKKRYLGDFPRYIDKKPARVEEKECHFHGASRCVYVIKAA